jgi:hypothetical protein
MGARVDPAPRPSEVRSRILAEHERLRAWMSHVEELTSNALAEPEPDRQPLCTAVVALCERFRQHMELEAVLLRPALLDADPWGEEWVLSMETDHAVQLGLVALLEKRAYNPGEVPHVIALLTKGLLGRLREDMQDEEDRLLNENLLKDDLVVSPEPD